jgi:1-acyl-sn-glycerol-3-phosphate acyltransferase
VSREVRDGLRYIRHEPVYGIVVVSVLGLFRALRLRVEVRGVENLPRDGGVVLAASHFSYVDFALVGAQLWAHTRRPIRYLATRSSFRHPLSGPLMRAARHVPVDRAAGADAYARAVEVLHGGEVIGIFPETRVSRSFELLPFKTGAVRLAAEAGVPLVPVTVWGSHRIYTRGRRPRLREAFRAPVLIDIGAPLTVTSEENLRVATARLRAAMSAQLEASRARFPLGPAPGERPWWLPHRLGGGAPEVDPELDDVAARDG